MPLEAEIKLRIPSDSVAKHIWSEPRVQSALLKEPAAAQMNGVYYDTADDQMSAREASLRLRQENGVTVAACKTKSSTEGALSLRNEWQCAAEDWDTALPLLVELGAPAYLLSLGELAPRCRVVFERMYAPLRMPDGSTLELAVDKGFLEADGKREELYELELEYLTGHMDAMRELGEYLEKKYRLGKEYYSKYARALRLIRSR